MCLYQNKNIGEKDESQRKAKGKLSILLLKDLVIIYPLKKQHIQQVPPKHFLKPFLCQINVTNPINKEVTKKLKGDVIIIDSKVRKLYSKQLDKILAHVKHIIIDANEKQKSFKI